MLRITTAAAVLAIAGAASAQLVVEQNLGVLPDGLTQVSGDTATGANNASGYTGLTNPLLTWTNELVYEFSLADTALLTLDFSFESADTDVFLLDGLSVTGGQADNALESLFLDGGPESTLLTAGTYFFSVDTFGDTAGVPASSAFTLDILTQTIAPYAPGAPSGMAPAAIDLGVIGNVGDSFVFDTDGSGMGGADTELGLYDQAGNLIASDDDGGAGAQSLLETAGIAIDTGQAYAGLGAGTYYLAISEFNTIFGSGFDVTGGLEAGETIDWNLNIDGTPALSGSLSDVDQVQWISFTIVPAPGAGALFAIGGLAAVRRRRA